MTRAGMGNLITRLRGLAADPWELRQDAAVADGSGTVYWLAYKPTSGGTVALGGTVEGTANWTLDSTTGKLALASAPASGVSVTIEYRSAQYTDQQYQDWLDQHYQPLEQKQLIWQADNLGGSSLYHRALVGWRDLEEAASGTVYWRVMNSDGSEVGTAQYTPDYLTGQVRFGSDTSGSALYVTARSYDLYGAAGDIWEAKAANWATSYDFSAGDQRFTRSQAMAQCERMAERMRARAGQNRGTGSGGVRISQMVRSDLVVPR